MKAFHQHKQWGVPIHRFGYVTVLGMVLWSILFVVPIDSNFFGNWILEFIHMSVLVIGGPPLFYLFCSRKFWIPKRYFGERKIKNGWKVVLGIASFLTVLLIAAFVIALLYYWVQIGVVQAYKKTEVLFRLAFFTAIIQSFYLGYEKSFNNTIVNDIDGAAKSYHFIIRSFATDFVPFIWGLVPIRKIKNRMKPPYLLSYPNFYQFLDIAIHDEKIDIVALGDPTKYEPISGVKNSYHSDETWQINFIKWANVSNSIIAIPENSKGLEFELITILKLGLVSKFFLVIPYINYGRMPLSLWKRGVAFTRNYKKLDLDKFVVYMNELGFKLNKEHCAHGSLIGFNLNAESVSLLSKSKNPYDFVDSINNWISKSQGSLEDEI